ncbi:MAG TPA: hypothetical protein PLA50_04210, partial [Bacteroidia bacterium]|nr:hypothetical protein [Bacteroidia bacterium]
NASTVEAEMGSLIIADGDGPGNGGRVILWSDERTSFGGEILARGGSGGFVEVSGKSLNFNGNVNTGGGILLLDPVNLTIFSGNTGSVGDDNLGDDVITGLLGSNNLTLTADNQITVQGDVEIDWAADTTLTLNAGRNIVVQSGAVIRSTYAGANFDAIVMNADGGAGGSNYGIAVQSNAILETHSGNIVLDGKGLQYGVFMSGTIRSNGIGKIDITGETTGNVAQGAGVIVQTDAASGFALVTSVDGDITIEGIGGGTGMRKRGILLTTNNTAGRTAVIESTGDARITMTGSGSTDATNQGNSGVYLQGEGAEVRSAHGDIAITGTGGDSSAANQFGNHGVGLESGARIVSSDDANITITGTAGGGSGLEWSSGVSVGEGLGSGGALSQIVTNNGHLIIHGVGSTSTSSKDDNHGIEFQAAGALVNNGIGSISLTGVSSNGDAGIRFGGATTVGGASAGDITLTADSIDVGAGNLTLQGSKELRIQQYTSTATIGVGNGATGDLALSNTVLDGIQDGFSHIYIGGETATGGVDIRGYAFKDSVTIQAPGGDGNIEVRGTLSTPTAGDSITLRAGGGITTFANARITTQNGAIGFFADTDDSGSGNIVFNGNGGNPAIDANASIVVNANGGSITLAGGSDGSGYAVGRTSGGGTNLSGISMHGTSLLTTGDITLRGKGAGQNGLSGDRQGISLSGGSVIGQTDGTGAISLTGLGGNTGANQRQGIGSGGSYNGSKVKTGTGAVKLTGTGGAGGVGGGSGNNAGLALSAITIESTGGAGAGKIELTGEAGNTAGNNTGTSLGQVTISSVDADIDIKGTGGIAGSNGAPSHGLTVGNGASITSSGAGSIELSGTATSSSGHGVLFTGTGNEVAAAAGNLTVTGVSVGASYRDIMVGTGSYTLGNAATTGNITVNADRADFGGGSLAMQSTGGVLRIQQRTNAATATIGVGNGSTGALYLGNAELDAIQDGFSHIYIGGETATGSVDVRGYAFKDSVTIQAPGGDGNVEVRGTLSTPTAGDSITLRAGGGITTFANARITTQNGAIGFFADTDDSGSGNIVFNGNGGNPAIDANASIVVNANGGSITLAGGSDGSGYAVGRTSGGGTNLSGISMHGTSLLTTGDITLRGKGAGQNGLSGDRQGISLSGGSVIGQTDGTGAISLTGLGGNTGANQRQGIGSGGSYNGSKVKTGTGAVKLTGTGGAGGVGGGSGNNAGLALSAITIESTGGAGAGKIELTGEAGNTAGNNTGTSLGQVTISSVDADIDIKGTGGIAGSNGAPSHGLTVGNGASITSSGAGSIELSGTATSSSGHGVLFTGTGNEVAAAAGNLTVTGVSVGASYRDIMVGTGSYTLGNAATTGNITVNADRA